MNLTRPRSRTARKISILACAFVLLAALVSTRVSFQPGAYGQSQPIFGGSFDLSNNAVNATNPDIWNVGSHVYVVWVQNTTGLEFRESPDGGATWSPPLSSPPLDLSLGGYSGAPLLSADGSNVYVVWPEVFDGGAQIMEATSTNYGQSFNWTISLTSGNSSNITPVIASWGDNVYVAWSAGTYSFLSCSNDSGAPGSWTSPQMYGTQHEPQIYAWGGQYVYAVSDAGLVESSNNCQSWQNVSYLHPWGSESWIWGYGPNLYATWESKGNMSVSYYSYSNNYGANWTLPAVLSTTLNDTWAPMLWAYGNSAWIAVHTYPGGPKSQVFMYTTNDAGASWSGPIALSAAPQTQGDTGFPFTVASSDGQNVFVAWSEKISNNYWQLFASYSPNAGLNWTAPPGIDISQNPNGTQASNDNDLANAAIASNGANCYAVWQYMVGSSSEIYFASTQFSPPTTTNTSSSQSTTNSSFTTTMVSSSSGSSADTTATSTGSKASSTATSIGTVDATRSSSNSISQPNNANKQVFGNGFGATSDLYLGAGIVAAALAGLFGFGRKAIRSRATNG